jgi:hypothetical protein
LPRFFISGTIYFSIGPDFFSSKTIICGSISFSKTNGYSGSIIIIEGLASLLSSSTLISSITSLSGFSQD